MRRLTLIAGLLALVSTIAPVRSVEAATRSMSLTAAITVDFWDDYRFVGDPVDPAERVDLWAPAAPACGSTPCPTVSPNLDAVMSNSALCALEDSAVGVPQTCTVTYSRVTIAPFLFGNSLGGPWCGYSSGTMVLQVQVGSTVHEFAGAGTTAHIGASMVWRLFKVGSSGDLNNVGAAVGTVTGSHYVDGADNVHDAACGLLAPAFHPTNRYDLALQLNWNDPL